jgi:ethanolamine utilization microcompartment shell protein EutS
VARSELDRSHPGDAEVADGLGIPDGASLCGSLAVAPCSTTIVAVPLVSRST